MSDFDPEKALRPPSSRSCIACGLVKPNSEFPSSTIDHRVLSARCNDCWGLLGLPNAHPERRNADV